MHKTQKAGRGRQRIKYTLFCFGEAFAVFSLIRFAMMPKPVGIAMALLDAALTALPLLIEQFLSCDLALPVHLFAVCYAPGAMLGNSYGLYYSTTWWDKLLHFSGGVAFAFVGLYLILLLNKKGSVNRLTRALFAVFLSVTVAVAWEFIEFGADKYMGQDMQKDRYVTEFNSCLLGPGDGVMKHVGDIQTVTVNGEELPGYVDIGLIDSMEDLLIETVGALLLAGAFLADKGKHPLVKKLSDKTGKHPLIKKK